MYVALYTRLQLCAVRLQLCTRPYDRCLMGVPCTKQICHRPCGYLSPSVWLPSGLRYVQMDRVALYTDGHSVYFLGCAIYIYRWTLGFHGRYHGNSPGSIFHNFYRDSPAGKSGQMWLLIEPGGYLVRCAVYTPATMRCTPATMHEAL